jgi:hypothetical protein
MCCHVFEDVLMPAWGERGFIPGDRYSSALYYCNIACLAPNFVVVFSREIYLYTVLAFLVCFMATYYEDIRDESLSFWRSKLCSQWECEFCIRISSQSIALISQPQST